MALTCRVARKDHRCSTCERRIPIGAKYWIDPDGDIELREHTNCLLCTAQEILPDDYNNNRAKYNRKR